MLFLTPDALLYGRKGRLTINKCAPSSKPYTPARPPRAVPCAAPATPSARIRTASAKDPTPAPRGRPPSPSPTATGVAAGSSRAATSGRGTTPVALAQGAARPTPEAIPGASSGPVWRPAQKGGPPVPSKRGPSRRTPAPSPAHLRGLGLAGAASQAAKGRVAPSTPRAARPAVGTASCRCGAPSSSAAAWSPLGQAT